MILIGIQKGGLELDFDQTGEVKLNPEMQTSMASGLGDLKSAQFEILHANGQTEKRGRWFKKRVRTGITLMVMKVTSDAEKEERYVIMAGEEHMREIQVIFPGR